MQWTMSVVVARSSNRPLSHRQQQQQQQQQVEEARARSSLSRATTDGQPGEDAPLRVRHGHGRTSEAGVGRRQCRTMCFSETDDERVGRWRLDVVSTPFHGRHDSMAAPTKLVREKDTAHPRQAGEGSGRSER